MTTVNDALASARVGDDGAIALVDGLEGGPPVDGAGPGSSVSTRTRSPPAGTTGRWAGTAGTFRARTGNERRVWAEPTDSCGTGPP